MAFLRCLQRTLACQRAQLDARRLFLVPLKQRGNCISKMSSATSGGELPKCILVSTPVEHVAHVQISNQKAKNALTLDAAKQLANAFVKLDDDSTVRCIVLSGDGPDLTSGVELKSFTAVFEKLNAIEDQARKAKFLLKIINAYQEPFKVMSDTVSKPIICCIHGLCYGLGMELAACSDIRYCSSDALMSIREVLISIAADVGSLQKLPKLFSNQSTLREFIYTGDDIPVATAQQLGFIGRVFNNKEETVSEALKLATKIASKSPIAIQGSKVNLRFSENKSFKEGLDYNAVWNMSMLQSTDVVTAVLGILSKNDKVYFEDY